MEEAVLKGSKGDWAWRKAETGPRDMEPMSCVQDCEQRGVVGAGCTHQGEWRKTLTVDRIQVLGNLCLGIFN